MTSEQIEQLEKLLERVFGFTSFRPGQLEIIETILAKQNVLAVMPTGAGKSLCYQLPAIYSEQKKDKNFKPYKNEGLGIE